jgi:hypothetical protein
MANDNAEASSGGAVAPARAAKRHKQTVPQLESQDDLAYLKGEHGESEQQKQVRTPAPRRPAKKASEEC